jgi:hypothetical protein
MDVVFQKDWYSLFPFSSLLLTNFFIGAASDIQEEQDESKIFAD